MQKAKEVNFAELTRRVLLQSYAPASVVTDLKGNIRFVHGDTGRYLRAAPGQATLNVVEMAREGLQLELRAAVMAASQGTPTLNRAVSVRTNGDFHGVGFSVRPLAEPDAGEELITVNTELQSKIEQLSHMQNDMKNLLDNINIGTVFLDRNLAIKRFTREAVKVYRLAASDVGRPLGDIKSKLEGEDLLRESETVLDTLVPIEREVRSDDGTWFLARVQPYRTVDNVIDGVVLTFTDITERIVAITEREARNLAQELVATVLEPMLVLDGDLRVVSASQAFYASFQVTPQDTVGQLFYELGSHQWDIPALREALETVLPRDQAFTGFAVAHDFPGIGARKLLLNGRRMVGGVRHTPLILLAIQEQALAP